MQDIHSIPGSGRGRLFSSSTSSTTTIADRRIRSPHHHPDPQVAAPKCPRCDSINTKFCYYNNYNLSQPRHFCKSCRRYWTKGGVLRNVPIGGGCRKTKRSKPKPCIPLSASDDMLSLPPPPPSNSSPATEVKKSSSRSSSDSSTLTAVTAAEAVSSTTNSLMGFQFGENSNNTRWIEANLVENHTDEGGVFVNMESLTSLMATSSGQEQLQLQLPFGGSYDGLLGHEQNQWHHPQEIITNSSVHVEVDLPVLGNRLGGEKGGEFGALEYDDQDQGLFDQLTNVVDQAYWDQSHQWSDGHHPTLYIPP